MWSYYTVKTFKHHADDEQHAAYDGCQWNVINKDAVQVLVEWCVDFQNLVNPFWEMSKDKIMFQLCALQL